MLRYFGLVITCILGWSRIAQAAPPEAVPVVEAKLTKPPKLIHFVAAEVSADERVEARKESVGLKLVIGADGSVEQVTVLESAGAVFDAAAVRAAEQFRFEPAELDGVASRIAIHYRYDYALQEAAPKLAEFYGQVRDRATKRPLSEIHLRLGSGQTAVTDPDGRFSFQDVAPGSVNVTLSGVGMTDTITEETLVAGRKLEVEYAVELAATSPNVHGSNAGESELDDLELVVFAPPIQKQVISTEVSSEQARRVAGTSGDVVRVVENLPGVARVSAGTNQLVVWGAAPGDTRTYVEGVRIPILYHSGGMRSVFLPAEVQNVELVPGGYAPPYGRGVGGLVAVTLTPLKPIDVAGPKGIHGTVGADLIDASADVAADIGPKARVALAARQSYLDRLLPLATSGVSDLYPIPRYSDAMARIGYQLSSSKTLHANFIYATDAVDRTARSSDSRLDRRQEQRLSFGRAFVTYESKGTDGSLSRLTPWVGFDRSRQSNQFAGVSTYLDSSSTLLGLRGSHVASVSDWLGAVVGIDAEFSMSKLARSGAMTLPSREGDVRVFGQPPSDQVSSDRWNTQFGSAAPFAEFDFHGFSDTLHVVPGIRIDPYVISVDKRAPVEGDNPPRGLFQKSVGIEPRLSARYALERRVTLKAGIGRYHQPPSPEELSANFGNPNLAPAEGTHLLAGILSQLSQSLSVDATLFHTWANSMTVRNPAPSPLVGEALVSRGEGRSLGAQFLLRKELSARWFGWVAYSIVRSQRRSSAEAVWRVSDYDQTHSLTAVSSYDLGLGIDIGARARVATGFPRTPVVGAYFDSRRNLYEPIFGSQNSSRIPMFFQLDVRVTKKIRLGTSALEVYLDVQNVTNRKNPEEVAYSANYAQKRYISGLPILPVLGANFQW